MTNINKIKDGFCCLGIELGSTRIKAVLIDDKNKVLASGGYTWNNELIDGYYSYSLDEVWLGIRESYTILKEEVRIKYKTTLKDFKAIGISAMMHGYLAFDKDDELLTPFRTWRNTTTEVASNKLSNAFNFSIPQRWSISHLYQAIIDEEVHVKNIDKLHTLASYIHYKLTDEYVIGIGDASGMFPIDTNTLDYNNSFIKKFDKLTSLSKSVKTILPRVLIAGKLGGKLTKKGALLLDQSGDLLYDIALCPPEGDAGTGMVSTNSVRLNTGNVSAGTSVFAMIVLEKELSKFYDKLDIVTTPSGRTVAMVHSNNCTGEYDAWIGLFKEVIEITGNKVLTSDLYDKVLTSALNGDKDCGGLIAYNYLSGETITGFEDGRPLFTRGLDSKFNLSNFMRTQLYTSLCSLRIGLDILFEEENIKIESITAQGGFFKTPVVGQTAMANATHTPINVVESAGEGGAWGIAILANYVGESLALEDYLDERVFLNFKKETITPTKEDIVGFNKFLESYKNSYDVERAACNCIK